VVGDPLKALPPSSAPKLEQPPAERASRRRLIASCRPLTPARIQIAIDHWWGLGAMGRLRPALHSSLATAAREAALAPPMACHLQAWETHAGRTGLHPLHGAIASIPGDSLLAISSAG